MGSLNFSSLQSQVTIPITREDEPRSVEVSKETAIPVVPAISEDTARKSSVRDVRDRLGSRVESDRRDRREHHDSRRASHSNQRSVPPAQQVKTCFHYVL
jgi:hypothetical protein